MPSDADLEWRYDIVMLLDAAKWKCRLCRQDVELDDWEWHRWNGHRFRCEAAGVNEMMRFQMRTSPKEDL